VGEEEKEEEEEMEIGTTHLSENVALLNANLTVQDTVAWQSNEDYMHSVASFSYNLLLIKKVPGQRDEDRTIL